MYRKILLLKRILWNCNLEIPVLKLVRSGHFRRFELWGKLFEIYFGCPCLWQYLEVTETSLFWITFPLQVEIVHTQSRIHVDFFFFFFKSYFWKILEGSLCFVASLGWV